MTPHNRIDLEYLLILTVIIGGLGAMTGAILVYFVFPFLR